MSKNSGNSPKSSFFALQERALDLIGSQGNGLFQSELRRLMSIDSSKCSKIGVQDAKLWSHLPREGSRQQHLSDKAHPAPPGDLF